MSEETYARIADSFYRRIDTIAGAVDLMAPGLETAAALLTQAVLEDRKILVCGCAQDATLAQYLAAVLRTPAESGPALPALALFCDTAAEVDGPMWRDLRTLSRDGDILLCVDSSSGARLAHQALSFAAQRNLVAITLSEVAGSPDVGGTCVPLPSDSARTLRSELLLMACHCLQEQIRQFLLGD